MASLLEAADDLLRPVMEAAVVLAAHYAKATGRDCVTSTDMRYGLMYASRTIAGKQQGSIYPEIYEEEDSEEDSEDGWETASGDEEEEEPFRRYEGTEEELPVKMNECADTWEAWEPESPLDRMLKNAVDKIEV
jgi:hypothetical protein